MRFSPAVASVALSVLLGAASAGLLEDSTVVNFTHVLGLDGVFQRGLGDCPNLHYAAFSDVIAAPDGETLIFTPMASSAIGVFKPATRNWQLVPIADDPTGPYVQPPKFFPANRLYPSRASNRGCHFSTGVLAHNGWIVLIPWMAKGIGMFNPATLEYVFYPWNHAYSNFYNAAGTTYSSYTNPSPGGVTYFGSAMYESAVVTPNGDVIMAPQGGPIGTYLPTYNGPRGIGIFNPQTRAFRVVPVSNADGVDVFFKPEQYGGFFKSLLLKDGRVAMIPRAEMYADVVKNTDEPRPPTCYFNLGGSNNICLPARNGEPRGKMIFAIFDPTTEVTVEVDLPREYWLPAVSPEYSEGTHRDSNNPDARLFAWEHTGAAVVTKSGHVVLAPDSGSGVVSWDPETNVATRYEYWETEFEGRPLSKKFLHGVEAPNGDVVFAPCKAREVLVHNPVTKTTRAVSMGLIDDKNFNRYHQNWALGLARADCTVERPNKKRGGCQHELLACHFIHAELDCNGNVILVPDLAHGIGVYAALRAYDISTGRVTIEEFGPPSGRYPEMAKPHSSPFDWLGNAYHKWLNAGRVGNYIVMNPINLNNDLNFQRDYYARGYLYHHGGSEEGDTKGLGVWETKQCDGPTLPSALAGLNCDALAKDGEPCGAAIGAICRHCCAASGYCGSSELYCSANPQIDFSLSLLDPALSPSERLCQRGPAEQAVIGEVDQLLKCGSDPAAVSPALIDSIKAMWQEDDVQPRCSARNRERSEWQILSQTHTLSYMPHPHQYNPAWERSNSEEGLCTAESQSLDALANAVASVLVASAQVSRACGEPASECVTDEDHAQALYEALPDLLSKLCVELDGKPRCEDDLSAKCADEIKLRTYCAQECRVG